LSTPPLTAMASGPWPARIFLSRRSMSMTRLPRRCRGGGAGLGPGLHGPAGRKAFARYIVALGLHGHLAAGARHLLGANTRPGVADGRPWQQESLLETPTQADRRGLGEAGRSHVLARLGG